MVFATVAVAAWAAVVQEAARAAAWAVALEAVAATAATAEMAVTWVET